MPKRQATAPSEADIIVNRSLLAYAELRRTVQSWSGLAGLASGDAKQAETDDLEDDESFVPEPETTGVGYVKHDSGILINGTTSRQALTSNEKLRRQLLGKRAKEPGRTTDKRDGRLNLSKPRPNTTVDNVESDEEEGRYSLGKKRTRHAKVDQAIDNHPTVVSGENEEVQRQHSQEVVEAQQGKSNPRTYLDELLASREERRKKRKRGPQAQTEKTQIHN